MVGVGDFFLSFYLGRRGRIEGFHFCEAGMEWDGTGIGRDGGFACDKVIFVRRCKMDV
jgi:hypothetical protein